jgi:hypothetical protein
MHGQRPAQPVQHQREPVGQAREQARGGPKAGVGRGVGRGVRSGVGHERSKNTNRPVRASGMFRDGARRLFSSHFCGNKKLAAPTFCCYNKAMRLGYDPEKNAWNIRERGLSFDDVAALNWNTAIVRLDTRKDYGENR